MAAGWVSTQELDVRTTWPNQPTTQYSTWQPTRHPTQTPELNLKAIYPAMRAEGRSPLLKGRCRCSYYAKAQPKIEKKMRDLDIKEHRPTAPGPPALKPATSSTVLKGSK